MTSKVIMSPTDFEPSEARSLSEEAYIFGYPPLLIEAMRDMVTATPRPLGRKAPLNQWAHIRDLPDENSKEAVGFNVDTLYSMANLDLSKEPMVLSIPPLGNRYWLMELLDVWNEVPAAPGSRTHGGKGGSFALVGPGWKATLPSGLVEIRLTANHVNIGGRTYVAGPADIPAVRKVQDQYKLIPLSAWGTDYKPPAEVPVNPDADGETPAHTQVEQMDVEKAFHRLCQALVANPPRPADAPLMTRTARLGIAPGAEFKLSNFAPDIQAAVKEGAALAYRKIMAETKRLGENVNGWQVTREKGRYGTDYLYRAAWARAGVGGNRTEDIIYRACYADSEGRPLSGEHAYILHFDKGQTPPVNAFWSLTMYGSDFFSVPNPIRRHALGDRSPMRVNADGSLDILISHNNPGADRESNWLPAPGEGFLVALRLYWPKQEAVRGTWQPPAVRRVS
jgi:hypothetical protein